MYTMDSVLEKFNNIHTTFKDISDAFDYRRVSFQFTKPYYIVNNDIYLTMFIMVDFEKAFEKDYIIRIHETFYHNHDLHISDNSIDIKNDQESIKMALQDILQGKFRLKNNNNSYILLDSDSGPPMCYPIIRFGN
jgi:hypothetical protein